MQCANCGDDVADGTVFCPSCGHRVRRPTPAVPQPAPPAYQPAYEDLEEDLATNDPERVSGCRWVALTGLFTLLFLVIIVGLGALGVYHGLQDQTKEKLQVAHEHYEKALSYIAEGNHDLAVAELEEALRLNPAYAEADLKLEEIRALESAQPTFTPDAYRQAADQLYRDGRAFYDRHEWDAAIDKLEELRGLDRVYQEKDVEVILFWAYYNRGLVLVGEGRMQEAIHRFDQALELQPDNPDALGQRHLASLYATGLGYWQADWPKAIEKLQAVYQIEPNYRDVMQRLHDAHVHYGDYLADQGRWCEAGEEYSAALEVTSTAEIADRRDGAQSRCGSQGTPVGPIGTPAAETTPAPTGTYVGQFLGYDEIASRDAQVRGRIVDAAGNGVPGQAVKIQAFDWSTFATSGSDGAFGFEALNQELTFTLTLVDLPHEPVEVLTQFGKRAKVDFIQQP